MELEPQQVQQQLQRLSQQQIQSLFLLQMDALELEDYLNSLSEENPVVDLDYHPFEPDHPAQTKDLSPLLQRMQESDLQNAAYMVYTEDELEPMNRIGNSGGLDETLQRTLLRQIDRLNIQDRSLLRCLRDLTSFIEDDGYLRCTPRQLEKMTGIGIRYWKKAIAILRTLEPAGVGAANLADCLTLQLQRQGEKGFVLRIAQNHLDALAKGHYRSIAEELNISVEDVKTAKKRILELDPKPGSAYVSTSDSTVYIQPDVYILESEGSYSVQTRYGDAPLFHINTYYQSLLSTTEDLEVRQYLTEKVQEAERVLRELAQRGSTLRRCAEVLADRQQSFFRQGPQALQPLRLSDIAQVLGLHESTVSRTIRGKYLECSQGIFPLHYFFSRPASDIQAESASGVAVQALLRELIDGENKQAPLSDQKLSDLLQQRGCPVSRRTVAKYRMQMQIPGTAARKVE